MNQKNHDKKHSGNHPHEQKSKRSGLHKDWRTWTVVILMLIAMAVYVLSFDESIRPGEVGEEEPRVPAAP